MSQQTNDLGQSLQLDDTANSTNLQAAIGVDVQRSSLQAGGSSLTLTNGVVGSDLGHAQAEFREPEFVEQRKPPGCTSNNDVSTVE
jgi:hypothetical protein